MNFATGSAQEAANWVEYMNGNSPGREPRSAPSWTRGVGEYYAGGAGRITRQEMTRDPRREDWSLTRRLAAGEAWEEFSSWFFPMRGAPVTVEVIPVLRREPLELGRGRVWTAVPDLLAHDGGGHVYQLLPREGRVRFGDGRHGDRVPAGSLVRISYESGPHDGFIEIARRMKAVDPSIRIGTSATFSPIPEEAAAVTDFVAANVYSPLATNDPDPVRRYYRIQAVPVAELEAYLRTAQTYLARAHPSRPIEGAVTEHNFNLDSPHPRSLAAGVYVADVLWILATYGVRQASYFHWMFLTRSEGGRETEAAPGTVFRLVRSLPTLRIIEARAEAVPSFEGTFDGRRVQFALLETLVVSEGDVHALLLINKHVDRAIPLTIGVEGNSGSLQGQTVELKGDDPFTETPVLATRPIRGTAGALRPILPPHSVSVLTLGTESPQR